MKKLLVYLTTLMLLVTSIVLNRPNVVNADGTTLANANNAYSVFKENYNSETGEVDWETLIKAARTYNLALEAEDNVDDLKSYYESITILDLSDQPITNQTYYDGTDIGSLAIFKGLKTLDLSNTNITKLGALASLTKLEVLNLSGNKELDEKGAIATLSNLKILSLEDTGFTNNDFGPIVALNNLVALNLMGNENLTNIGPLAQCPNLKGLEVSDTGLSQLQEVATFPNILEYLGAKNLQLTSNQAISGLVEMTNRSSFDPSTSSLTELDPNLKTYYWDLDGSVMPTDPDNHVTMIKNKFTGGNFIPPKIGNKLDSPTDLFWRIDAVSYTYAQWTPIENLWPESDDQLVDKYLVYAEYGTDKNNLNVKSDDYRIYDRAQDFQDFINTNKEGYYRFTVQALAKEGNGYVDSDPVSSEIVKFNKFTYDFKTVDEDNKPIEGEVDSGFVALYDEDEGGSVRLEYIPDNVLLSLNSFPKAGYEYVGYTFTPKLEDVKIDGMNAYFYLDKSSEAIVTFKRNNEPVKINIDFGEKHKELASKVLADINADNKHTATLSGSVLTIDWLINDTMNKVLDEYVLKFADLYLDEYGKDNNEYLSATPYGSKKINEYKDRTEMNADWADVGRSFTADGMKVYLNWEVLATSGSFTLETPKCGTEVETAPIYNSEDPIEQTNTPVVEEDEDSQFVVSTIFVDEKEVPYGYWYTSMPNSFYDYDKLLNDTIVAGKDYVAAFYIEAKPGYIFDFESEDLSIKVNGKEADKVLFEEYGLLIIASITADHDWQFVDFTWNQLESAIANYKCSRCDETNTVEVNVTKTIVNNKNVYTALVNKENSLDGEKHQETKETVDLTIRWSSMDGVDLMEPIVFKDLELGITLAEAFIENDKIVYEDLFTKEGYNDSCYRVLKPYTEYSNWENIENEDDDERVLNENTELYEIIDKEINTIDLTVTIPNVGDTTTTQELQDEDGDFYWDWDNQTNKPVVSVANEEVNKEIYTTWIESASNNEVPYIGIFEDGKKYTLDLFAYTKLGYYFSEDLKVNVNGEVKSVDLYQDGEEAYIIVEIEVLKHSYNVDSNATITGWYKGSNIGGKFVFKRSISDELTYSRFTGIKVDDKEVDKSNYKVSKGSAIVELNASYLETLSVGEHTLTALFTDGSADTKFNIIAKTTPSENNTPRRIIPNTSSK